MMRNGALLCELRSYYIWRNVQVTCKAVVVVDFLQTEALCSYQSLRLWHINQLTFLTVPPDK